MNPTGADGLRIVQDGLPPTQGPRKRVVIVGAGMAGLAAASELLRAGTIPSCSRRSSGSAAACTRCASRSRTGCTPRPGPCASRARTSSRWPTSRSSACHQRVHDEQPRRVVPPVRAQASLPRSGREAAPLGAHSVPENERGATWQRDVERALRPFIEQARRGRRRRLARDRRASTTTTPRASSWSEQQLVGSGDRDVRPAAEPGSADERVVPRTPARGGRELLHQHGADRRRHGSPAARLPAGARGPDSFRRAR